MAKVETVGCPACGARNPQPLARCASCGVKLEGPRSSRHDDLDRRQSQDRFSGLWCGISLAIAGVLTGAIVVGLPLFVPVFDFEGSAGMMLSIPIWFLAGILVGLISPGRTILEPMVATFLVAIPTAVWLFSGQTVKTLPAFMYVLLSALGVLFATIGSYLGERIQVGPVAHTDLDP
jgi:hypothetical protein